MKTWSVSSTDNRACMICRKRTGNSKTHEQFGVKLNIPLCEDHYDSIDGKAEADRASRGIRAQAEAARQLSVLRPDWAGARKMTHYCHEPLSAETRHIFWIAQAMTTQGELVAVGSVEDGDDQRTDCTVALARFTTAERAQAFAEDYLAHEAEKGA